MVLYEKLVEQFGYNEPFLYSEISFGKYSKVWISKELNKLCEQGIVSRFDKGIYYLPMQTPLGPSIINPRKVIEKRYIQASGEVFGYYSGQILLNRLGISTQMPNVIEIYTNNESSKVRDVSVGCQKVRLRRSRVNVTKNNAPVLSFLELMNSVSATDMDTERKNVIIKYMTENGITRKDITQYAPIFPDKTMRNLIESEVIYSVAQEPGTV